MFLVEISMSAEEIKEIGRKNLEIEKPVELIEKKGLIKLPTGVFAKAAMQTFDDKHVLTIDSTKQDFIFEYTIYHELCHAKLNEMGIKNVLNEALKKQDKSREEVYKCQTVGLLIYEFYADYLCNKVFGIDKRLINAYYVTLKNVDEINKLIEENQLSFFLHVIQLFLFERLQLIKDVVVFFDALAKVEPKLLTWVEKLHHSSQKLPPLSENLDEKFIGNTSAIILEIYKTNPLLPK